MSFYRKPRIWALLAVLVVAALGFQQFWRWVVERKEVGPGEFLVVVHRWGKELPEDDIVAPDATYQGVMLDVLTEGRHFINPLFWGYERHQMIDVPDGKCLVLTRKYGRKIGDVRIARGDFLAGDNERGIVRDVLRPGKHRVNPYAYGFDRDKDLVDAVQIRADQVGVRVVKVGQEPPAELVSSGDGLYVVPDAAPGKETYRGVQRTPVRNGTYYLNPHVEAIIPVDVRSHKVEFNDIFFPSRDGFLLKPQVVVEYAVRPDRAALLFVRISDEGKLHQGDGTEAEQLQNEILQKIMLPHIRGAARIEGSNFYAKDFIITADQDVKSDNSRERLRKALEVKVKEPCEILGIHLMSVTLAELTPPEDLAKQIAERDLARVEREKNQVRLGELKTQQALKADQALKPRAKEKTEAETLLSQAKVKATQLKEVEESRLKQDLENAMLRLEASRKLAEAVLAKGKTEAAIIQLQNEAEVAGLRKAVQGFQSVQNFAQYHVLAKLGPAVSEIFTSDDSELAKLLTHYLNPPAVMKPAVGAAAAAGEERPAGEGPKK